MEASGVAWDENTIAEFVRNTRMPFVGLNNDQEIANPIARLKPVE